MTFYRVDTQTTYQHIDALFTQVVDWDLIARHWQDMMQVVLSIQAGHVVPSMLLRKSGIHSRHSAQIKPLVSWDGWMPTFLHSSEISSAPAVDPSRDD